MDIVKDDRFACHHLPWADHSDEWHLFQQQPDGKTMRLVGIVFNQNDAEGWVNGTPPPKMTIIDWDKFPGEGGKIEIEFPKRT